MSRQTARRGAAFVLGCAALAAALWILRRSR